jgi:hypothetical protein
VVQDGARWCKNFRFLANLSAREYKMIEVIEMMEKESVGTLSNSSLERVGRIGGSGFYAPFDLIMDCQANRVKKLSAAFDSISR